jgi:MbtH protein
MDDDTLIYLVVTNYEEQYSIWPTNKPLPAGWKPVGAEGRKSECLQVINEMWTDMRPLSLRSKTSHSFDQQSCTIR